MSDQSRITVLLGAGAAIEIGAPTTACLTSAVRSMVDEPWPNQEWNHLQLEIMVHVFQELDQFYQRNSRNGPANFEDAFHAIEQLISLKGARIPSVVKAFMPVFAAFTRDDEWLEKLNEFQLFLLPKAITRIIGKRIHWYCEEFAVGNAADWFLDFWRGLGNRFALDIATLNYDNLFEQIFPSQEISDGYANTDAHALKFSPEKLSNAERHRLMHLHGSILFGWPQPGQPAPPASEPNFQALYKYKDFVAASASWGSTNDGSSPAQSGDTVFAGPLITGLRKTDKLLSAPYIDYNHQLYESLRQNERLLIIGYGFGDYHINALLKRLKAWHGDRRRFVVIDYINDFHRRTWSPFNRHFEWGSPNLFTFWAAVASEAQPFPPHGYRNPNRIGSDERGLMFFEGFKQASAHLNEIADFFAS